MPWEKKSPADRTLVFDTFVSVSRLDALFVYWPDAELNADDLDILKNLLANLTSLGRAEGWCMPSLTEYAGDWNCVATDTDADPVPVLCPIRCLRSIASTIRFTTRKKLAKGQGESERFPVRLSALATYVWTPRPSMRRNGHWFQEQSG